ncbi:carbohydrate kinase family protein [Thermococcus thioreducens]|uniref:Fructokinase n=1 Tax=Thermococcus thioreducens TaxID=277988 RepID=A0A0Q2RFX6_9EURY|nr:carbohydrate kinase [Thermococcus thioreducens]ASJ13035.1 sugar kinase [Thermococcus thioreducens]KQH82918.1 sugar kinase [Thermococcus thioreducens]SEV82056.1 fructokinase [Thermococcus thioreducens]
MIVSIGEVLIDFIALQEGKLKEVKSFEKHPGGAPANVAVGLSRLGVESALVSKVGDDPFGDFLIERLTDEGVKTFIPRDLERHTGVVFVQLIGARPEFILYDGVAYFNLKPEDVETALLERAEVVHFGSVLFAREPSRSTLFGILEELKGKVPLSYDVNIRLDLWRGREDEMLQDIERALKLADIVKLGDGELAYLRDNGISPEDFDFKLFAVTLGAEGSELRSGGAEVHVPAYSVEPVDTTGAGDAFMAALLAGLHYSNMVGQEAIDGEQLRKIGRFANLVAALSTTLRGAWSVPKMEEIVLMKEVRELYHRSKR